MHVLILSKDFKEDEGISDHTREFASQLSQENTEVSILSSEENSNMEPSQAELHEVPLPFEADNIYNWAMMLNTELQRKAVEISDKKDIDIVHSQDWLTASAGIMISEELDADFFITVHSTENQRGFGEEFSELISTLEWEACYEAKKVFVKSEETRGSLINDLEVPEEKIKHIENPEDIREFYPVRAKQ